MALCKVQLETPVPPVRRAAQYVRMSTEHQKYSPDNQMDAISAYAIPRRIDIVRTYADHGRSGLDLHRRQGLRNLIDDVANARHDFTELLVYDVSRWGRFLDVDESAYYEYICKRAGVRIHYCAEPFENDGSLSSMLLKTIKRSMAAEYSRDLSKKVFAGQSRLVEKGFHQGGRAGYGFRRQLIDQDGKVKCVLNVGECKSLMTDRVVLIHGPEEETFVVRNIFDLHNTARIGASGIARLLNECGIQTDRSTPWTRSLVGAMLKDPKYAGVSVYNRHSFKLRVKAVTNPPNMWIRCDDAFAPIVPKETFAKAQEIKLARTHNQTDEEVLERLRFLWSRKGEVSARGLAKDQATPWAQTYGRRFGTLGHACELLNLPAPKNSTYHMHTAERMRHLHKELYAEIKAKLIASGALVDEGRLSGLFRINDQVTVRLKLSFALGIRNPRWQVSFKKCPDVDLTILARLKPGLVQVLDFFLLPHLSELGTQLFICAENACQLDAYRFDSLEFFLNLWKRKVP